MKIWLLVLTSVSLTDPSEQLLTQLLPVGLDGGACLTHYCNTIIDKDTYKTREACDQAGHSEPQSKINDLIIIFKCEEVNINWIQEQQVQIPCPPQLQQGYQAALRLLSYGNIRAMQSSTQVMDGILRTQKALGCRL